MEGGRGRRRYAWVQVCWRWSGCGWDGWERLVVDGRWAVWLRARGCVGVAGCDCCVPRCGACGVLVAAF